MGKLDGRVAVITGAGRGIGAAAARQMAAEGASIVVVDIGAGLDGTGTDEGPAQEVVSQIKQAGGNAIVVTGDVSDSGDAEGIIRSAVDEFGRLDVLINAAGILRDRMLFNMSEEEWDDVIRVHLKGCFNTSKFASIYWRAAREGDYRLINFSSIAGIYGNPSQPNYAAAKMGIYGFTMSCANALAKYGVTSNCISPGAATRMAETIPDEKLRAAGVDVEARNANKESRAPEAMVPAILYIASKESAWLNGRMIGAQENRISLWSNPEIQRQIISTGPWELDDVFDLMPRSFQAAVEGRKNLTEAG